MDGALSCEFGGYLMLAKLLNPFWWFGFFGTAVRWWLVCELFSLAVVPICFYIFRVFKDRGYGFAKIFGIFFITYINWLLCTILPFSFGSVLFTFLIVCGLSAFFFLRVKEKFIAFWKRHWRLALLYEAIFLFSFLFFVNVRSYAPDATFNPAESGAEKFLNCAYLNDLMRVRHFPPRDSWLCGNDPRAHKPFYVNYYYVGHLQWATLAKFAHYGAAYAFSLGLATIFALTFIGAFSLGTNLTRQLWWGFLAAFMVALFGNLDALQQVFERIGFWMSHKGATQTAWESVKAHTRIIFFTVDYWRSSRIVQHTITEFPFFTAILGDLHPHHSSLPIVLLAMGGGMNLVFIVGKRWQNLGEFFKRYWLTFLFLALAIGGTFAANTWDAIVLGFSGAAILVYLNLRRWGNMARGLGYSIASVAALGILSVFLFLLFKLYFASPVKNDVQIASLFPLRFKKFKLMIAPLTPSLRTHLSDYFVHFGLFLFPIILYSGGLLRRFFKERERVIGWVWLFAVVFVLVLGRGVWRFWLPGCAIVWMLFAGALLAQGNIGRRTVYFLLLSLVVAFFTLFVEIFFFDDRYTGKLERYNTLFKIYYPLWSFLALGATYSFARLFRRTFPGHHLCVKILLGIFLAATVVLGMLYPMQATAVRTDFFQTTRRFREKPALRRRTLDATAYFALPKTYSVDVGGGQRVSVSFKDDAKVLEWIRKNVKGRPVVLEAVGGPYSPFSRVSSTTGLPTICGWTHHIAQHRGGQIFEVIGPREADVKHLYTTTDIKEAKALLKKYNIRYVMVGALENAMFPASGLAKFPRFLKLEVKAGKSALYGVP